MRLCAAVLVLALTLGLSACGDDGDDSGEKKLDLDKTPSATATDDQASESPSVKEATDDKPVDDQLLRGSNPAKTEEEKAVAEVWFAYWDELVQSYLEPKIDRDRLAELAKDDGFSDPEAYVARMKQAKTHNVGGMIAGIRSIEVDGGKAEVRSCMRTTMIEVNKKGVPVETPEVFLQTVETLEKEGPTWRVADISVVSEQKKCKFR